MHNYRFLNCFKWCMNLTQSDTFSESTWRMHESLDKWKWYVLETMAKLNHWVKSTYFFFQCIHGTRWKFSRWKNEDIYNQVIYYFPSRWKKIYLKVFSPKFLFQNFFLKFLTKISVKELLNILFSIKMENIIFNIFLSKIFVSPSVYKLIGFSCIEAALHKKRSVRRWTWTIGCR